MHAAQVPDPTDEAPATVPCLWCSSPTVPDGKGTRPVTLAGKPRGTLCPPCAADSFDLEADARDGADYTHGARSWV